MLDPTREQDNVPGRRKPPPVPPFSKLIPGETGRLLEDDLRHLRDAYSGLPGPHARTHLQPPPSEQPFEEGAPGSDPLQAPAAVTTVDPTIAGTVGVGPSYALEDHRHALDLTLNGRHDGDVLTAASGEPGGMKWAQPSGVGDSGTLTESVLEYLEAKAAREWWPTVIQAQTFR